MNPFQKMTEIWSKKLTTSLTLERLTKIKNTTYSGYIYHELDDEIQKAADELKALIAEEADLRKQLGLS